MTNLKQNGRAVMVVSVVAAAFLALGTGPAAAGPDTSTAAPAPTSAARTTTSPLAEPLVASRSTTASATASAPASGKAKATRQTTRSSTAPPAPTSTAPPAVPGTPPVADPAPVPPAPVGPTAPAPEAAPAVAAPAGVGPMTPPEPHIIGTFANGLSGPRRGPGRERSLSVPQPADVDGCDRNYGVAAQCVPKALPGGVGVCAYLAQRDFKGVKVNGADRKGLDRNRNGIACD